MDTLTLTATICVALFTLLLLPYLVMHVRRGKRQRRSPVTGIVKPRGTGSVTEGRFGDPAPGEPDGRADPRSARARRSG